MIVIAGWIDVDPASRDELVAASVAVPAVDTRRRARLPRLRVRRRSRRRRADPHLRAVGHGRRPRRPLPAPQLHARCASCCATTRGVGRRRPRSMLVDRIGPGLRTRTGRRRPRTGRTDDRAGLSHAESAHALRAVRRLRRAPRAVPAARRGRPRPAVLRAQPLPRLVGVLKQPELWSNRDGPGVFYQEAGVLGSTDDPDHARHRRTSCARRSCRPRSPGWSHGSRRSPTSCSTTSCRSGEGDFVELFALPFPAIVIGELLGVRPEDRDDFQRLEPRRRQRPDRRRPRRLRGGQERHRRLHRGRRSTAREELLAAADAPPAPTRSARSCPTTSAACSPSPTATACCRATSCATSATSCSSPATRRRPA